MRGSIVRLVAAMMVVAGCGSSAGPSSAGLRAATVRPAGSGVAASGVAGSDGRGVAFEVTVSFSGAAEISGSFLDTYTGRSFSSCAAYVNAPLWTSPGAVTGTERIGGLPIAFDFATAPGQFAGPGHYAPGVMGRLAIGADTFSGTESWVTLSEDGSGSGWFNNFTLDGVGQATKLESGTVTWTCSQ